MVLLVACIVVAGWDTVARRVPNVVLIVLAAMQCATFYTGTSSVSLQMALLGCLMGFFLLLPFYVFRLMGAGDVKFAALIGFIAGWKILFLAWLIGSLCAGLHALIVIQIKNRVDLHLVGQAYQSSGFAQWFLRQRGGRKGIPYAAYLALGACVAQFFVLTIN